MADPNRRSAPNTPRAASRKEEEEVLDLSVVEKWWDIFHIDAGYRLRFRSSLTTNSALTLDKIINAINAEAKRFRVASEPNAKGKYRWPSAPSERYREAQRMLHSLDSLWEMAHVDILFREKFRASHQDLDLKSLREIRIEVERLFSVTHEARAKVEEANTAALRSRIDEARSCLKGFWIKLRFPDKMQNSFEPGWVDISSAQNLNNELLEFYEGEIHRCRMHFENMRSVLDLIERRESILADLAAVQFDGPPSTVFNNLHLNLMKMGLPISSTWNPGDPKRLLHRRCDRLLDEEKVRIKIRDMPAIEAKIVSAIKKYEISQEQPLVLNGELYSETLHRSQEFWKERIACFLVGECSKRPKSANLKSPRTKLASEKQEFKQDRDNNRYSVSPQRRATNEDRWTSPRRRAQSAHVDAIKSPIRRDMEHDKKGPAGTAESPRHWCRADQASAANTPIGNKALRIDEFVSVRTSLV